MPLLPGKKNIGHNIEAEEAAGKPRKQAVAIALRTAGVPRRDAASISPVPRSQQAHPPEPHYGASSGARVSVVGTYNEQKKQQAKAAGALMSHDAPEKYATTAMTLAEINRKNQEHWDTGPAVSAASEPARRTAPIPVYHPHDEVSPTQSDPADFRSDNLLERAHGGLDHDGWDPNAQRAARRQNKSEKKPEGPLTKAQTEYSKQFPSQHGKKFAREMTIAQHPENDGVVASARQSYGAGKAVGERLAEGEVGDDRLPVHEYRSRYGKERVTGQDDSGKDETSPLGRAERKNANPAKLSQRVSQEIRNKSAKGLKIAAGRDPLGPRIGRKSEHMWQKYSTPENDSAENLAQGSEALPVPRDAEHPVIKRYNAAIQAEHEAKLKTPEGNAERIRGNEERLKRAKEEEREKEHGNRDEEQQSKPEKPKKIEAHGVKGMNSTPWRKTFKSSEHLSSWAEKNSAKVHATRETEDSPENLARGSEALPVPRDAEHGPAKPTANMTAQETENEINRREANKPKPKEYTGLTTVIRAKETHALTPHRNSEKMKHIE